MARRIPSLTITLTWDELTKRWRIDWIMPAPAGRGVISHWDWLDTTASVDAVTAHRICDCIKQEVAAQLW